MSVYSYVVLKVHTNVRKVGTHLNVCFVYRTCVRWKYTFLFVWAFYISIYNEHTFFPPFSFLSIILYILYLYTKMEILFPAHHFLYAHLFTLSFIYLYYTLYIQGIRFPATFYSFPAFSFTFIILLIYRRGNTFPAPFSPLIYTPYKVNTFSTATFFIFLKCYLCGKFAGKSFWKLY